MPFKGFNSILLDFYSLIDIELSYINFISHEYRDCALYAFDKHKLLYTPIDDFKFNRVFGTEDVFKSVLNSPELKDNSDSLLHELWNRDEEDILSKKYAINTSMINLIKGYSHAGNGVIRTTVRCDNKSQYDYVKSLIPDQSIEISKRSDIDMSKYARLIVGGCNSVKEYKLKEPKSILILNFRENFSDKDITLLNPELVISFGDIHDIEVISAFQDIDDENSKG